MINLFRAFFFKLTKDLTFRITAIIGVGLAIVISLIFFAIDKVSGDDGLFRMASGQNLLITSLSPTQNFGLSVPINLITFTVLEFTQGTIRNKIIAGNSKGKIYASLFISGLIFTLLLMFSYIGICFAMGCIFGGFNANGTVMAGLSSGNISPDFIIKELVLTVFVYMFISAFTLFFATLFRNIGPCIPIVIIVLMALYFTAAILGLFNENLEKVMKFCNPLYGLLVPTAETNSETFVTTLSIANDSFVACMIMNTVYSAILFVSGLFIFKKRDIK